MTTWLEIRSETMESNAAVEISWTLNGEEGKEYTLSCITVTDGNLCGWYDVAFDPEGAIELKNVHLKWHEEGMPP